MPPRPAGRHHRIPTTQSADFSAGRFALFRFSQKSHAFLLRGDVFTSDVIETWLDYKRKKEIDAIRLRPHPHEFHLYYDI